MTFLFIKIFILFSIHFIFFIVVLREPKTTRVIIIPSILLIHDKKAQWNVAEEENSFH
jgi:hypothetical protein